MASFIVLTEEQQRLQREAPPEAVLRCLTSELGCLTRQDGSASLSQGDTTVTAVAYGPAEVRMARERIDRATVEVVYKPKVGLPRPVDRKKENIIRNTLESAIMGSAHPRSAISVIIQETEDLGSNLACCINAACLALLDAAVGLNFMVAAVASAVMEDGKIVTDPEKKVEEKAVAVMTFVFESVDHKLVSVLTYGKFTQEQYKVCRDLCRQTAQSVFAFYRESLEKKLLKTV
ncbi:exosome complex component RRP46 [Aplysia californica]|uniref:Exosome complex component RRP46 n=1 Tax=Aplysia californica TaxID=6500 RepID=A0ABM0K5J7_APLCA|nr:exosome complex component RRP46 [Aplysia californica]